MTIIGKNLGSRPAAHYPLRRSTLIRVRWLALTGQTLSVLFVTYILRFPVHLKYCLPLIGLSALLNLWLVYRPRTDRQLTRGWAAAQLAFDSLQLAGLLWLTGGLQNPFALLLLAPVAVSAAILPRRQTILVGTLAVVLASILAVSHLPLPWDPQNPINLQSLYVLGTWVAILLGIVFVATYSSRVAHEARQLADALAATELTLSRQNHLSALDGLAAAAAHELGTPLSTIALVAKEMLADIPEGPLKNDVELIFEQSGRCRTILSKLRNLDDEKGSPFSSAPLSQVLLELTQPFAHYAKKTTISTRGDAANEPDILRNVGLLYGLGNLIENAVQFAHDQVAIVAEWTPDTVSVTITDDGPGIAPDLINRLGEPYLTTRRRSYAGGLGLGVFIAKTLLERTGANIKFSNVQKQGHARITLTWARYHLETGRDREVL